MKMMNKFCALMLSVALCAGMAAPAFAYGGEPVEEVEQPVLTAATEEEEAVTVTDEETGALTPEGNLTLVDDGEIFIGSHTMIGPNVTLVATGHPVRPDLRYQGAQYSLPVHIGENVWIGANVTVLPGVTIGDNAVIGANSLVTKDIPANTVAYGSPCKVIREINERDDVYYWRDRQFSERFKLKEQ